MNLSAALSLLERVWSTLTLGRVVLAIIAGSSGIALYRLYEERAAAFDALLAGPLPLVTLVAAIGFLTGGVAVDRLVRMAIQRAAETEAQRDECHKQLELVRKELDDLRKEQEPLRRRLLRAEQVLAQHSYKLGDSGPGPLIDFPGAKR